MALADFNTLIERMTPDPSGILSVTDRADALAYAILRYSNDRPHATNLNGLHTVNPAEDTIPALDREAVCCWAAAQIMDQLSANVSGDEDSTIDADSVDHGAKAGNFAKRAREYRARYWNQLGIDPKRNAAASQVVDLDRMDSRGRARIFRTRGLR
jgi:hypothetical protein